MTERTTDVDRDLAIRRHPERGRHEREIIDAILDEAPFCHVGFVDEGGPDATASQLGDDGHRDRGLTGPGAAGEPHAGTGAFRHARPR